MRQSLIGMSAGARLVAVAAGIVVIAAMVFWALA